MNSLSSNQILKEIPVLLAASTDLEVSMRQIVQKIKNIFGIENAAIYYFSEENAYLKSPENDNYFNNFNLEQSTIQNLENNPYTILNEKQTGFNPIGLKLYLFPLKIRTTVFGFVCAATKDTLDETQIDTLCAYSSVAAYSIKDTELSNVFKIQLKSLQSSIIDKTQAVKTIKEQNEKILEADKAKNEFIANISHELRTPLNAIIGFSEVLSSKIFGELNEKQAEYINDIYTSGVHLLGMINEILDISKLESNAMKLHYTEFCLDSAIKEVISVMNPLADKKNINVSYTANVKNQVYLDFQKIQQIMYNLLSNAIKFTPNNGKVKILIEQTKNNTIISVEDNGIGIDKNAQSKIFDKFVQLENTYTKTGSSTGLGLTITKKFVEMMNGTINLTSKKGQGTKFTITLPNGVKND